MMSWLSIIRRSNFLIRLLHWEYWPFGIVQFPLFFYYPWLALRARSLTFFAASNPGIVMGGMFGESKFDVLSKIPAGVKPKTILIKAPATAQIVVDELRRNGLAFPVIFKPDMGERGFMVKKISSIEEVSAYIINMRHNFIAQELVDAPLEFGVFYRRLPNDPRGVVTSVVMKEMLFVEGDGKSALRELILQKDRAKLQWQTLRMRYANRLNEILPAGEKLEIVSIGNHCLGTKFINGNHLITPRLSDSFDQISKQIDGFYFGRFDLRCNSISDLENGNVMILELNGCGAEPAHIYDPNFPLYRAVGVLIDHWQSIFNIARQNIRNGHPVLPLNEALAYYHNFKDKVK